MNCTRSLSGLLDLGSSERGASGRGTAMPGEHVGNFRDRQGTAEQVAQHYLLYPRDRGETGARAYIYSIETRSPMFIPGAACLVNNTFSGQISPCGIRGGPGLC